MEKLAEDIKIGDKFQPYISERTMKRVKTTFIATGLPEYQTGSFSHFVIIPCVNSKGIKDEIIIHGDCTVIVVE